VYARHLSSAHAAILFFSLARSGTASCMSAPSQTRYVQYFEEYLDTYESDDADGGDGDDLSIDVGDATRSRYEARLLRGFLQPFLFHGRSLRLRHVRLHHVPSFVGGASALVTVHSRPLHAALTNFTINHIMQPHAENRTPPTTVARPTSSARARTRTTC
jgi:hypothetical protein